jgi:hypothetical protein
MKTVIASHYKMAMHCEGEQFRSRRSLDGNSESFRNLRKNWVLPWLAFIRRFRLARWLDQ